MRDADMAAPLMVVCQNCQHEVANGSIYCPHCCGSAGQQRALLGGALGGAILGTVVGLLLAGLIYIIVGPERGTWGMVFSVTITGATSGLMLGMVRKRKG